MCTWAWLGSTWFATLRRQICSCHRENTRVRTQTPPLPLHTLFCCRCAAPPLQPLHSPFDSFLLSFCVCVCVGVCVCGCVWLSLSLYRSIASHLALRAVPLAIMDRQFNDDGTLSYPSAWTGAFTGDFLLVNGKVTPFLRVERRAVSFPLCPLRVCVCVRCEQLHPCVFGCACAFSALGATRPRLRSLTSSPVWSHPPCYANPTCCAVCHVVPQ